MDEKLKKTLLKILWWIPIKSVRILLIEIVYAIFDIKNQNEIMLYSEYGNGFIVVEFGGGFTDQLFHYRLVCSLEKLYNKKVKCDISLYNEHSYDMSGTIRRHFELNNVELKYKLDIASEYEIELTKKIYYANPLEKEINLKDIMKNNKVIYLHKFIYQNGIDLIDITSIIDLDKLKNKLNKDNKKIYVDIIKNDNTVACHVRRTDYILNELNTIDEIYINYFQKAINLLHSKINKKLKIYLFSDDIKWIKEILFPIISKDHDCTIVDNNKPDTGACIDFYLISLCKYQIASKGSFCKTAYEFNKYENKILITMENVDNIKV